MVNDILKNFEILKVGHINTYIDLNARGCLMNVLENDKFRDPFIFQNDLYSINPYYTTYDDGHTHKKYFYVEDWMQKSVYVLKHKKYHSIQLIDSEYSLIPRYSLL